MATDLNEVETLREEEVGPTFDGTNEFPTEGWPGNPYDMDAAQLGQFHAMQAWHAQMQYQAYMMHAAAAAASGGGPRPPYGGYPPPWPGAWPGGYGGGGGGYGSGHYRDKGYRKNGPGSSSAVDVQAGDSLMGRVWQLARDANGCRRLQDEFDSAKGDEERAKLAEEIRGHVWEAIECKNANHVIQKYIVTMRPEASQFIIDELMSERNGAWHAARHCFGCRVVERLLEHCRQSQVQKMVAEILMEAVSLCKHQYGNYVAQHLLEHGAPEHQKQLAKVVRENALSMCTDYHAVAVVSQALCGGAVEDRVSVARAILDQKGLVVSMARSRHGQEAVKHLLQVPRKEDRDRALRLLTENIEELKRSRYGRVVAKHIGALNPDGAPDGQNALQQQQTQEEGEKVQQPEAEPEAVA